jgi:hypothetical protein
LEIYIVRVAIRNMLNVYNKLVLNRYISSDLWWESIFMKIQVMANCREIYKMINGKCHNYFIGLHKSNEF